MNKTEYLDRIKTQFESAKAKAESVINPQKMRPVASSSDFIPFHDVEFLQVPQNENLVEYLNPINATKQTYRDYPLLNVETVLAGDDELKVVLPRRPALGQVCIIDWLNVTMNAVSFQTRETAAMRSVTTWQHAIIKNVSQTLKQIFGFAISHQLPKGMHFYDMTFELEHKAGLVCIGGQSDTVLIQLNGEGCTYAKYGWESDFHAFLELQAIDPKITRIDLAHDDLYGDYTDLSWFARQYDLGGFSCHNHRPEVQMLGNWKRPNGKGRTFFVGVRKSSKCCRMYERGKKLGDKNSPWLRTELELKSKNYFIPLDILLNPSPYFLGAYPCFHIFDHQQKHDRDKLERVERQENITFAKSVEITRHQFGRYLNCFREEFSKHGLTDNDLLDLLTEIENKKYPDRLNGHSIPDFFKPKATH